MYSMMAAYPYTGEVHMCQSNCSTSLAFSEMLQSQILLPVFDTRTQCITSTAADMDMERTVIQHGLVSASLG